MTVRGKAAIKTSITKVTDPEKTIENNFDLKRKSTVLSIHYTGPTQTQEHTIGVLCLTFVWMAPSFSNCITSLSGSQGLVL